ncbi:MAG TPA: DUF494 family protein [Ignavibacteriaceae bacterium]|nr:DUF494 family protein [Ignavibacteriaceae bacterium]
MITEIVEVLVKINEIMKMDLPEDEKTQKLNKETKYDKNVIAAAYSWLHEKDKRNRLDVRGSSSKESKSFRTLSVSEIDQLGVKNYNYILHFYNLQLLTNSELENILEELKYFSEEAITIDQINLLILSLFLDLDRLMLPGSRILLYSSDTIN